MWKKFLLFFVISLALAGTALAVEQHNPVVQLHTSRGNIKVELFEKEAPVTVANFLAYATGGFYDGTIFHRVIAGFMIQGGGFTPAFQQKATRAPIANEASATLKNSRGTIAMARTSAPDSATSQFFINLVDNAMLNRPYPDGYGYAVFGRVIQGMEVVDNIGAVKTGRQGDFQDVPVEQVRIISIKRVN